MFQLQHAAAKRGGVPEALGVLEMEGQAQVTCRMVEWEASVDNVIRPHAKSIVHQGSHAVIPGRAESRELGGPLERQEGRLLGPVTPSSPPRHLPLTCCVPRWQLWAALWCPM